MGVKADDVDTVRMRLREASYLGWRNWWIEAAFWYLKGEIENEPVYRLLQIKDEIVTKVKVCASTREVRDFERRKSYLDDIRKKGIEAVKIRVKDPARKDDITILKQVRKEIGDNFVAAVDANQG